MNYRHLFHAGNFADVVKHVALTAVLLHLRKKETPFAVIDSHAGRGLYDLASDAARTTGEAQGGIEKLRGFGENGPAGLRAYLGIVRDTGVLLYPGSPLIAAKLLRPGDRLVAIEKRPEEAAALVATLAPFRNARAEAGDGYARLAALLPPRERRGLILIDPPYESAGEFAAAAQLVRDAFGRFATGIYLLWFPVKSTGAADSFCGEVLRVGVARALRIEIDVTPGADGTRLTRAGLLMLNPPYGFAAEMRAAFALIEPRLGQSARGRLVWLAGGED